MHTPIGKVVLAYLLSAVLLGGIAVLGYSRGARDSRYRAAAFVLTVVGAIGLAWLYREE
jgi:hypothetical protein